jgi:hypothetical protein
MTLILKKEVIMLEATRKHPCKCFICKVTISTTEGYADKVQKNKYECLKCVGMRLIRKAFKIVRISNG